MAAGIVKLNDKYIWWSTIPDAPINYLATKEDMKREFIESRIKAAEREIEDMFYIADKFGTSFECSAEEIISNNRAGKNDTPLSKEEIIVYYSWENRNASLSER
jgi:hypothetical protein